MSSAEKENEETVNFFKKIANNVSKMNNINGEETVIIKDSQFINVDNEIDSQKLSPNNKEAVYEAMYVAARKQEAFDYKGTDDSELEKAQEAIVDRFVRDYIDKILELE